MGYTYVAAGYVTKWKSHMLPPDVCKSYMLHPDVCESYMFYSVIYKVVQRGAFSTLATLHYQLQLQYLIFKGQS